VSAEKRFGREHRDILKKSGMRILSRRACLLAAVCTLSPFRAPGAGHTLAHTQQRAPFTRSSVGGAAAAASAPATASVSSTPMPSHLEQIPLPQSSHGFVNASTAAAIDVMLMQSPGFSIDQLMELAGLSVATAAHDFARLAPLSSVEKRVLIMCGPGNNGGDGLVAARHLSHMGYSVKVLYPKPGKGSLFENLVQQCRDLGITIVTDASEVASLCAAGSVSAQEYDLVIDALFGFSFTGKAREPYLSLINVMRDSAVPTLSVDVPSGWEVDAGDVHASGFRPDALISLTVPKLCAQGFRGQHYVGGRFITPGLAQKYNLNVPNYGSGASQTAKYVSPHTHNPPDACASVAISGDAVSVVYVTASSNSEAKHITKNLLSQKLAACVNLLPVTSMYEWEGEMQESSEILMMIKTRSSLVPALTVAVQQLHSYDVPEVISVPVEQGSPTYLYWVRASCKTESGTQSADAN